MTSAITSEQVKLEAIKVEPKVEPKTEPEETDQMVEYYIIVSEKEGEEGVEMPLEPDDTLALSTLHMKYAGAVGLEYKSPPEGWGDTLFVACVPSQGVQKRPSTLEEVGETSSIESVGEPPFKKASVTPLTTTAPLVPMKTAHGDRPAEVNGEYEWLSFNYDTNSTPMPCATVSYMSVFQDANRAGSKDADASNSCASVNVHVTNGIDENGSPDQAIESTTSTTGGIQIPHQAPYLMDGQFPITTANVSSDSMANNRSDFMGSSPLPGSVESTPSMDAYNQFYQQQRQTANGMQMMQQFGYANSPVYVNPFTAATNGATDAFGQPVMHSQLTPQFYPYTNASAARTWVYPTSTAIQSNGVMSGAATGPVCFGSQANQQQPTTNEDFDDAPLDLRCPAHPAADLIEDHRAGDLICPERGLVVGDRLVDVSSEWRSFSNENNSKDPSRVGAAENALLSGSNLSTTIASGGSDADNELASLQSKQMTGSDRQLISAFRVIGEICERIHLAISIKDQANALYKQVLESKQLKDHNPEVVTPACVYIACRKEGVPRTFKEICDVSRARKKSQPMLQVDSESLGNKSGFNYVTHLLHITLLSKFIVVNVYSRCGHSNRTSCRRFPVGYWRESNFNCAAAIYMASQCAENEKKTAKEIGDVARVAEVSIRESYKLMYPKALDLFPSDFRYYNRIHELPPPNSMMRGPPNASHYAGAPIMKAQPGGMPAHERSWIRKRSISIQRSHEWQQ